MFDDVLAEESIQKKEKAIQKKLRSSFWKISADEDFLESSLSVDEYLSTNILKRIFFPDFRFSCTKT